MRSDSKRRRGGFSLIEISVVVAIISVIAVMGLASLGALKTRANFSAAASEVLNALRYTRAAALARGVSTAFIIDTVGNRWWSIEKPSALTLDTFSPSAPGTVIKMGRLPSGITFGPTTGFGAALAAPMAGIPTVASQSPNYRYCSYCRTSGTNTGFGMIEFQAGSAAIFSSGPSTLGQQFTLTSTTDGVIRTVVIAIVARTGASQSYEN